VSGSVVVGVDGSPGSLAAVLVAAGEAVLRGRSLRVVHAVDDAAGPPAAGAPDQPAAAADQVLAEAVGTARDATPGLAVTGEVVGGRPAAALVAESRHALLVVVGDRGLGELAELVVGSVAVQVAAHAGCPVLVVRGDPARAGDVLLGVDDSPVNEPAVEFAFQEAALRGTAITALHAWGHPAAGPLGDPRNRVAEAAAGETRLLAEALARWQEKYPDVTVHRTVVQAGTRAALIEASRRAQLAVVGARGRGGFTGLLLGSVSHALLHHADCPLVIVRHTTAAAREGP